MTSESISAVRKRTDYERFRRPSWETKAMSTHQRRFLRVSRLWKCCCRPREEEESPTLQQNIQYRIPSKHYQRKWKRPITTFLERGVVKYTFWNYRTTFARSILGSFVLYLIIVHIFAFLLWGLVILYFSRHNEACLTGWLTETPYHFVDNFVVAFSSSWTTASTVGYGVVSPPGDTNCHFIRFTLAIEAFVGLLFSSYCSAIIFTKIQRVELGACVEFSSCLCVQYGPGVTDAKVDIVHSLREMEPTRPSDDVSPYPVLEMRIVNTRRNASVGTIVDATVKCVVTSLRLVSASGVAENFENDESSNESNSDIEGNVQVGNDSRHQLRLKRKFQELKLSPDKHPHFTHGALYYRHVLDENSPLLRSQIKERIRDVGGWPSDLNNPANIHDCLSKDIFDINVTFKGTSNFTAGSVFKMHSFKPTDIYVGWQFAKLGYVSEDSTHDEPEIHTDTTLLHDIVPQNGGNSEPLGSRRTHDDLISFLASVASE